MIVNSSDVCGDFAAKIQNEILRNVFIESNDKDGAGAPAPWIGPPNTGSKIVR